MQSLFFYALMMDRLNQIGIGNDMEGFMVVRIKKVNIPYLSEHFEELLEKLYPERRERVKAFKRQEPACVSMAAGLLLQDTLTEKLGILPSELVLEKNGYGKPSVKGHPDFHFNLSHAGEYIALGFGNVPIGVDIERIREQNGKVAKRVFTEKEYHYVMDGDADMQDSRFFELWTMKEAYLKLTGQGISVPLNSFEIDWERQLVVQTESRFVTKGFDDYWLTICTQDTADIRFEWV